VTVITETCGLCQSVQPRAAMRPAPAPGRPGNWLCAEPGGCIRRFAGSPAIRLLGADAELLRAEILADLDELGL